MTQSAFQNDFSLLDDERFGGKPTPQGPPTEPRQRPAQPVNDRSLLNDEKFGQPQITLRQDFMLGLIKEDPNLQVEFLKKQGFDSKLVDGEAKIKKGAKFVPFSAEGIDFGDVLRFAPEIVEGFLGALTTSAKVVGATLAPVTGGASFAAATTFGGLTTGGVELGKQALAKGLDLREDIDLTRVARQAVIGAGLGGAFSGVGQLATKAKRGIETLRFGRPSQRIPDVAEIKRIKAQSKEVGLKPSPAQLSRDPAIRAKAALDVKLPKTAEAKQAAANRLTLEELADDLVKNKTERGVTEVKQKFVEEITESVNKRLAPAEKIYREVEAIFPTVKADKKVFKKLLPKLKKEAFAGDPQARGAILRLERELDRVSTLDQLKAFRTSLRGSFGDTQNSNVLRIRDQFYDAATVARTDSLTGAVKVRKGVLTLEQAEVVKAKIGKADKIWKDTTKLINRAIFKEGKVAKFGPKRTLREVVGTKEPDKILDFLRQTNVTRAQALKELSPKGFRELANLRISKIAKSAEMIDGNISMNRLLKEIEKNEDGIAKLLFGDNQIKRMKVVKEFLQNIPKDANPSGTATGNVLLNTFLRVANLPFSAIETTVRVGGKPVVKTSAFVGLSALWDELLKNDNKEEPK